MVVLFFSSFGSVKPQYLPFYSVKQIFDTCTLALIMCKCYPERYYKFDTQTIILNSKFHMKRWWTLSFWYFLYVNNFLIWRLGHVEIFFHKSCQLFEALLVYLYVIHDSVFINNWRHYSFVSMLVLLIVLNNVVCICLSFCFNIKYKG